MCYQAVATDYLLPTESASEQRSLVTQICYVTYTYREERKTSQAVG